MQDYTYNHLYRYIGPVLLFDKIIASEWTGETKAPTARKAKSNLIYQFKKQQTPEQQNHIAGRNQNG